MLRSALILAALVFAMPFALAQTATVAGESVHNQASSRDESASTTTGAQKPLPFKGMMESWEYSAQEWQ